MLMAIIKRLGFAVFAAWFVSTLIFFAITARPGDLCVTLLNREAQGEKLAHCRAIHGLDAPILVQYGRWMTGIVQGDFGMEIRDPNKLESRRNRPVAGVLGSAFLATIQIGALAAIIAVPTAIGMGILTALKRDRLPDIAISTVLILLMTVPEFAIATVLQGIFSEWLGWVPAVFFGSKISNSAQFWAIAPLPVAVLSLILMAHIQRLMRSSMIDALNSDYARTARLNGIPEWRVVLFHCIPTALPPTISLSALTVAWLLSGVTIIENVFNYPGLGRLLLNAVFDQQTYLAAAVVLSLAVIYIILNLLADVLSMAIDPRQRR
jgi:peptide/nickel transport system permease protein